MLRFISRTAGSCHRSLWVYSHLTAIMSCACHVCYLGFRLSKTEMGAWPHCFTSSPDVPSRLQIWVSLLLLPWGGGGKWNWVGSLSPKLPLHWGQARVSKNANNFPTLLKMAFSGLDISSVFVNHCLSPRVLTKLVLTVSRLFQSFYGEQDLRDSKPITESF